MFIPIFNKKIPVFLVKKVDFDPNTSIIVCILTKTGRSVYV